MATSFIAAAHFKDLHTSAFTTAATENLVQNI